MGTWDIGPFDNDAAADWCGDLNDVAPEQRAGLIRTTLNAVVDTDGYLDVDLADEAIAAAAVVAAQLPGGDPITPAYAPDFLLEGGSLDVPDDVPPLAVRALDRIVADESEWRSLWAESAKYAEIVAALQQLRAVLDAASD
ncbi:DUF4259 domain-containing protein [Dactylosporangium sp. NPDC048998]|uniref:DUF4259 domain-containing protein n=1 Tax=Dactylosporangium sp. NPDC048998 TaxID=3363976 RepID=UPI0037245D92